MGASLSDTNVTSDGYDQYTDTDMVAARITYSVMAVSLMPLQISINLLTILAICVFKRLYTIQNVLVANMAFSGLLAALTLNPATALFWLPDYIIHVEKSNKYVCLTFLVSMALPIICSAINETMIAADRFFAIVYPIRYRNVKSMKMVWRIIIVIMICDTVFAFLPYFWNNYSAGQCNYSTFTRTYLAITYFFVILCLISSSVFNMVVAFKVFQFNKKLTKMVLERKHPTSSNKDRARHAKLSVLLYTSYVVLYIPYLVSAPLVNAFPGSKPILIFQTAAMAFGNLHFSFTTMVYLVVKKDSREAIKLLLTTAPWRWSKLRNNVLVTESNAHCVPTARHITEHIMMAFRERYHVRHAQWIDDTDGETEYFSDIGSMAAESSASQVTKDSLRTDCSHRSGRHVASGTDSPVDGSVGSQQSYEGTARALSITRRPTLFERMNVFSDRERNSHAVIIEAVSTAFQGKTMATGGHIKTRQSSISSSYISSDSGRPSPSGSQKNILYSTSSFID